MKKYIVMLTVLLLAAGSIDAHGGGGHGGGHGGWRGGHRGGWGRGGWGWGPGFGVGFTIPVGGGNTYVEQVPAATNPYTQYMTSYGDPRSNPIAYKNWLFANYPSSVAQAWWNSFQAAR